MHTAVTQLAVVQIGLLAHLASLFCHTCHFLAHLLAFLNLLQYDIGDVSILVQEIVYVDLDEVTYELVYGYTALGSRAQRAQLDLRLALEQRLLQQPYRYGYRHTRSSCPNIPL